MLPGSPDNNQEQINALLDKAFDAFERGQLEEACTDFEAVLSHDPQAFDALNMLGVITMQKRDWPQAIALFERAIAVAPDEGMAHTNLGLAYIEAGQHDQALISLDKAVALEPSVEAFFGRGMAQQALQQWAASVDSFTHVVALQPNHPEAHCHRGTAFQRLHRHEDALKAYDQALTLDGMRTKALNGRGDACLATRRFTEALGAYEHSLALKADQAEIVCNRAIALQRLGRLDEAIAGYERAVAMAPEHAVVLSNLSGALRDAHRNEEALAYADRAVSADNTLAGAHLNRGNALLDMERLPEAIKAFSTALSLQPADVDMQWSLGWACLLAGDWAKGLPLVEVRWKRPGFSSQPRPFSQPLWLGDSPLQGRTILLHSEQGLGDTLQFCRYAAMVAAQGAKVIIEVQPPLKQLMRSLAGPAQVIAQGEPLPAFDLHCPLMSLPLAFKSTPDDLPAQPYLQADPQRVRALASSLGPHTKPRIGLVWSGNAAHRNDANRSMPLATLLSALPSGPDYFRLQKDIRDTDKTTLSSRPDIRTLPDTLESFDQTAALVASMDLIISIDTSLAHLAGALGKPCWILLSRAPDWRWLIGRHDCPWYPTARLFRQTAWGQWDPILADVGQALNAWLPSQTNL